MHHGPAVINDLGASRLGAFPVKRRVEGCLYGDPLKSIVTREGDANGGCSDDKRGGEDKSQFHWTRSPFAANERSEPQFKVFSKQEQEW